MNIEAISTYHTKDGFFIKCKISETEVDFKILLDRDNKKFIVDKTDVLEKSYPILVSLNMKDDLKSTIDFFELQINMKLQNKKLKKNISLELLENISSEQKNNLHKKTDLILRSLLDSYSMSVPNIAEILGMSPQSFYLKLKGDLDWRQPEIQGFIDIFNLDEKEVFNLFFRKVN